jgi:Uma2 family endonuclease
MTVAAEARLMTTEELLAMPDDGVERWLIRGQLREASAAAPGEAPMTVRNRWHSLVMAQVTTYLGLWRNQQPEPRGRVFCGEAGVRLRRDPDTTIGADVVYISPELAAQDPLDTTLIDGVPVLAVEILSPNDTQEQIHEKLNDYLASGVALVWVIDPYDRTVRIYRPDAPPELVNDQQELTAEPHLSGFRVAVRELFA